MLLVGYPPFEDGDGIAAMLQDICRGRFDFNDPAWELVTPEAKDLVKRMLTVDPKKRITAKMALHH
eukprot:scaffold419731_cov39-Prasinocladus_malaysianus.AAC.1